MFEQQPFSSSARAGNAPPEPQGETTGSEALVRLEQRIARATNRSELLGCATEAHRATSQAKGEHQRLTLLTLRAQALHKAGHSAQAIRLLLPTLKHPSHTLHTRALFWSALVGACLRSHQHTLLNDLTVALEADVARFASSHSADLQLLVAALTEAFETTAPTQERLQKAWRIQLDSASRAGDLDAAGAACMRLVTHATRHERWKDAYELQSIMTDLLARRYAQALAAQVPTASPTARDFDMVDGLLETMGERQEELAARESRVGEERQKVAQELARMSHEIRTPLHGLTGAVSLLQDSPLTPEQREYADTAVASSELALGVINRVLDLSKLDAGGMVPERSDCSVVEITEDVLKALRNSASKAGLTLRGNLLQGTPLHIHTDGQRVRQILTNLVGNAIKFTRAGSVEVQLSGNRDRLRIAVRDTGVGIPPSELDRVFERFYQSAHTAPGGTGLGLAITRELVRLLDGQISVKSAEGVGTTFQVSIPTRNADTSIAPSVIELMRPVRTPPAPERHAPIQLRVLVAEDNELNRRVVERTLQRLGCDVVTAADGAEALERTTEEEFDVVLMDCNMPRLDGWRASRMLRKRGFSGRIIGFTANTMEDARRGCLAAGMDDVLTKPARLDEMREVLTRAAEPSSSI